MTCTARPHRRLGLVLAPLLVALQVGSAVLVPVLHARAESRNQGPAIETTHTAQCAVVHSEARCSLGTHEHPVGASTRRLVFPAHVRVVDTSWGSIMMAPRETDPSANGVRAPPLP